jgi:hypothetical protein
VKKLWILTLLCQTIFLVACNSSTISSNTEPLLNPDEGKSTIHGLLLSTTNEPQTGTTVRLAEVYRGDSEIGAFVLDEAHSPSTISEDDGQFYFLNIAPGEYVLFVGLLHSNYKIVSESDQTPIVYKVSPGETLEIDPIIVEFD